MTLTEYLHQRKTKIISDIERDDKIDADNYHNVGLLKEIEKIIIFIERNKSYLKEI